MKSFKPLLAPNEKIELQDIKYPVLASYKMDGIRCIFYKGQILSRSLKQIQNEQIRGRFETIRKYTENNNLILDGEIYAEGMSFQNITHYVMTQDLKDEILPQELKFYCFDCLRDEENTFIFRTRLEDVEHVAQLFPNIMEMVGQGIRYNKEEVENLFEEALQKGYEGLILRNPTGLYKFGRGTIKEGIIYKVKPFATFDTQIIDVVQSTEVNENAEKTINELGRSVTSNKKADRNLIEKASAFRVMYKDKELKVTLAMSDEEKILVWGNKETYIGKWIEYKGMMVGAKDVPRHPVMIRFREDKN